MKIKNRHEILNDIIKDARDYPNNWKAVLGKDHLRKSDDYYLFHPHVGLYHLKEYHKNPYVTKGVGGKIARHVDEDLERSLKSFSNHFGIVQGDIRKIASHLEKGVPPHDIIDATLKGKDMGIHIPLKGKATQQNESFSTLKEQVKPLRKKIDTAFEKMTQKDGLHKGYD